MKKHEKVCNINLSMKTEDSFITMLFDGNIGTMFKQDVGKIEIKDNMDGESILNELKSIVDGTMGI